MPPQLGARPPDLDENWQPVGVMVNGRPMSIADYNANEQPDSRPASTPPLRAQPATAESQAEFQKRVAQVIETMRAAGTPVRVASGTRTDAEQARLFAQGQNGGTFVTPLDGVTKRSRHQDGMAVDFAFTGNDPYSERHPWPELGKAIHAAGLTWGGDFNDDQGKPRPDRPHAELHNPDTYEAPPQAAPSDVLRAGAPTGLIQPRRPTPVPAAQAPSPDASPQPGPRRPVLTRSAADAHNERDAEAAAIRAAQNNPNRPPDLDAQGRPIIPTWASKISPGIRDTPLTIFGANIGRVGDVVDFAEGATAGVASTLYHSGDLVRRAIGAERTINSPEAQQRMHAPENFAGWLGNTAEQGVEFLAPVSKINKATASWNLAARLATEAGIGAATTGIQSGGDPNAMAWGAGLGALVPAAGATFRAGQRTAAGYSQGGVRGGLAAFMRKAAPLEASVLATQALGPRAAATEFRAALDRALPEIKQSEKAVGTIDGLTKFNEALKDASARVRGMYEAIVGPGRARHVDLSSVADAMEASIPAKTLRQDPAKAAEIIDRAATYRQPFTLANAEQHLLETNAQVENHFAQFPGSRHAARTANPKIAYLEAEGDALRKALYSAFDPPNQQGAGEAALREIQKRYGALLEVRQAAEARINQAIAQSGEVVNRGQVASDAAQAAFRVGRGDILGAWRSARYAQRGLREQETIDTLIKRAMAAHKGLPVAIPMPVVQPPAGLLGPGAHQMPPGGSAGPVGNTGYPVYPPVQGRTGLPPPSFRPMGPVPPSVRDAEVVSHVTTDARPPAGAVDAEILGHGPYQGEVVDEAGRVVRPPAQGPAPIIEGQIVKPKPEKVSRVDPRQGTLGDVVDPSPTKSTAAARTHPLVSPHSDEPFAKIIRRAQDEGYQGDPAHLRAELDARLSLVKDQQEERWLSGQNPDVLLREIAKGGGISESAETSMKKEIVRWKEAQDTTTRKVAGKPAQKVTVGGQVLGIKGVFKDNGKAMDAMLEYLGTDKQNRFRHITTVKELEAAIDLALVKTPVGHKAAINELEQSLRSGWWQQVEHRQQVGTIGDALGDDLPYAKPDDDVPF